MCGSGHAERNIIDYANRNNLRLIEGGATRPVGVECAKAIGVTGASVTTPLKAVR